MTLVDYPRDLQCTQEYAEPGPHTTDRAAPAAEKSSPFSRFASKAKYPVEQRIEDKKRGIGRQKYPFVGELLCVYYSLILLTIDLVWTLTAIMTGVFIYELIVNSRAQGTPVSFKVCFHFVLPFPCLL